MLGFGWLRPGAPARRFPECRESVQALAWVDDRVCAWTCEPPAVVDAVWTVEGNREANHPYPTKGTSSRCGSHVRTEPQHPTAERWGAVVRRPSVGPRDWTSNPPAVAQDPEDRMVPVIRSAQCSSGRSPLAAIGRDGEAKACRCDRASGKPEFLRIRHEGGLVIDQLSHHSVRGSPSSKV